MASGPLHPQIATNPRRANLQQRFQRRQSHGSTAGELLRLSSFPSTAGCRPSIACRRLPPEGWLAWENTKKSPGSTPRKYTPRSTIPPSGPPVGKGVVSSGVLSKICANPHTEDARVSPLPNPPTLTPRTRPSSPPGGNLRLSPCRRKGDTEAHARSNNAISTSEVGAGGSRIHTTHNFAPSISVERIRRAKSGLDGPLTMPLMHLRTYRSPQTTTSTTPKSCRSQGRHSPSSPARHRFRRRLRRPSPPPPLPPPRKSRALHSRCRLEDEELHENQTKKSSSRET